jgi:hypothetical protein
MRCFGKSGRRIVFSNFMKYNLQISRVNSAPILTCVCYLIPVPSVVTGKRKRRGSVEKWERAPLPLVRVKVHFLHNSAA